MGVTIQAQGMGELDGLSNHLLGEQMSASASWWGAIRAIGVPGKEGVLSQHF